MWKLIKELPWKWIGIALAIAATVAMVFFAGVDAGKRTEQAEQAKRNEAAIKAATNQNKTAGNISAQAGKETVRVEKQIEFRTKRIIERVPEYITVVGDSHCRVPVGFVQLYNSAAAGNPSGLAGSASGNVDADSGVALSAVGEVTTENFGICHKAFARVKQWEDLWADQAASWAKYKGEIKDGTKAR